MEQRFPSEQADAFRTAVSGQIREVVKKLIGRLEMLRQKRR